MKLKLPFPLTGSGKSRRRQKYIREVRELLTVKFPCLRMMRGDLSANIRFFPPDNSNVGQPRDLDNLMKPVLDAIKGIAIDDDSQIKHVIAEIMSPEGNGRVIVNLFPRMRRQSPKIREEYDR